MNINRIQADSEIHTNTFAEARSCRTCAGDIGDAGGGFGNPDTPRTDIGVWI
jgi:hypothetical protein